ncbi:hypothetical protein [Sphingomonas sp.]|uniref:hypothetical protein n=1 Tax=Sphingomonas sp. TaxID=28214 RepID=UPI001EC2B2A4|nr:hypothetical protein [Sphingomonas sp.]MBX3594623.1 hypothetical protein [Sphingomonas sp.]
MDERNAGQTPNPGGEQIQQHNQTLDQQQNRQRQQQRDDATDADPDRRKGDMDGEQPDR